MALQALGRAGLATTLALTTLGATSTPPASASAEHDDCVRRLLEAPIEHAKLPEGWQWEGLYLGEYYWRSSPSPASLVGQLSGASEIGADFAAWLWLTCVPNSDLVLERMVDSWVASEARLHEVGPIGDQSIARSGYVSDSAFDEGASTFWRNGDALGRVHGGFVGLPDPNTDEGAWTLDDDLTVQAAIARAVGDVLTDAGLAGPITSVDPCVRRLVEAPVEAVLGPYGPVLHVFETTTPAWLEEGFSLSCQPEAARFMERWAEVEQVSADLEWDRRAEERAVDRVGDGSMALAWFDAGAKRSGGLTLLWQLGDVFAEVSVEPGESARATEQARLISELVADGQPGPVMALTPRARACVQRLLEAPIETLRDWRGKRRGDPWYGLSLGYGRAYATWTGHPRFELGCHSGADLIIDRAAELTDEQVREIGSVGDRAVAIGPKRYPTLWWRDGDVLGQAHGDDLDGLTRFARRVVAKSG